MHAYCPLTQHLNKMPISGRCALNQLIFTPLQNMNNGHVSCVKTGQKRKKKDNAQAACRLNTLSAMDVECEANHVQQKKAVKGGNETGCDHTELQLNTKRARADCRLLTCSVLRTESGVRMELRGHVPLCSLRSVRSSASCRSRM